MSSFDEVFAAVKEYCKERLVLATYNLFIDGIEPVSFEGSVATLSVRSDFVKGIVETRYKDLLREAFKELLGFDIDVELTIPAPVEQAPAEVPGGGNYEFTFENFIVGSTNKFAHAAAQAVAANPSGAYNPLFIWGGSGLGKTHLLGAIQFEIHKNFPDYNIVYVDGEKFTNEIISAIHDNTTAEFHNKYRAADVLLVDDIQFIAGKKQTQEEFFHTFNTLYESGRQIVLTSDRPPREMTQLEDRLQTRFEWGLMVDVAPPDFETRLAIIKNKAALLGVQLPDDISSFIAENLTANVRQIEGALNKLLAYRDLLGNQVDGEAVSRAVKDMLKKYNEFVPSPALIIEYICRYYDVDEEQVRGQGRKRDLMEARQTAMYLIRRMTNLSLNDIGKEFGDRDHTTVLHSLDQVEKKMRSDPAYAEKVKEITTNINNKK